MENCSSILQFPPWNGPKSETPAALTGTVPADSNYICTPGGFYISQLTDMINTTHFLITLDFCLHFIFKHFQLHLIFLVIT